MSEGNGHTKKSLVGEALELLEDQMELASVEWQYEKSQGVRRIVAVAAGILFACLAIALMVVAGVIGLMALGLTAAQACLAGAATCGMGTGILVYIFGRRDPRAGIPFQGSREEAHKNIRWIRQFFS